MDESVISAILQLNIVLISGQILILETDNLETIVRIPVIKEVINNPDRCLAVPFLSLCKKYLAMLFWKQESTEPSCIAATFKVEGLLTDALSLKELARISVRRSTKLANIPCLPLPDLLKEYLVI